MRIPRLRQNIYTSSSIQVPYPLSIPFLSPDPTAEPRLSSPSNHLLTPSPSRHKKSHTHPAHCPICNRGFETAKDVRRHQNDVHETKKRYFCSVEGCKYARNGNEGEEEKKGGFPRKDNLKRHLRRRHGIGDEKGEVEVVLGEN
jgi:hypothetical protein